jgi:hypothetical protein
MNFTLQPTVHFASAMYAQARAGYLRGRDLQVADFEVFVVQNSRWIIGAVFIAASAFYLLSALWASGGRPRAVARAVFQDTAVTCRAAKAETIRLAVLAWAHKAWFLLGLVLSQQLPWPTQAQEIHLFVLAHMVLVVLVVAIALHSAIAIYPTLSALRELSDSSEPLLNRVPRVLVFHETMFREVGGLYQRVIVATGVDGTYVVTGAPESYFKDPESPASLREGNTPYSKPSVVPSFPKAQVAFWIDGRPVGQGFRIGDYLVTASHVADLLFMDNEPKMETHTGRLFAFDQVTWSRKGYAPKSSGLDLAILEPITPSVWSVLGVPTASLAGGISSWASVCYRNSLGCFKASGPVPADVASRAEYQHQVHTEPGASGAPMYNANSRVIGMHVAAVGDGKTNLFIPAPLLAYFCRTRAEESDFETRKIRVRTVEDAVAFAASREGNTILYVYGGHTFKIKNVNGEIQVMEYEQPLESDDEDDTYVDAPGSFGNFAQDMRNPEMDFRPPLKAPSGRPGPLLVVTPAVSTELPQAVTSPVSTSASSSVTTTTSTASASSGAVSASGPSRSARKRTKLKQKLAALTQSSTASPGPLVTPPPSSAPSA